MNSKPIRVLVVDDSAFMRASLARALQADGDIVVVETAPDPLAAREAIKVHQPDVLTLDVEMPKMDGLEFLERLMRLRPMPVVMVSTLTAQGADVSLAALELVTLPSRLVESVIAASVVLAALNNLFPVIDQRRWAMAFAFGLIHGFGFASVLTDLGLPRDALVSSLFGFNLGVELGQLAIVAVFLPLAFALRASRFYRRIVFTGGSVVVVILAAVWLLERALNLKLL
ncbi:MAG TPA: hypothetical protein DCZ49_00480 [Hyphomonadaceae bacterium]|nr:hypothetical protein [Hyphomonadaceae bacterium]